MRLGHPLRREVYIVKNARNDPRTLTNPLVSGEFGLQFYAAAPLRTHDGNRLGTFCLINQKQRYLNEKQKLILQDMAAVVMDEIELRLAARQAAQENDRQLDELRQQLASKA